MNQPDVHYEMLFYVAMVSCAVFVGFGSNANLGFAAAIALQAIRCAILEARQ